MADANEPPKYLFMDFTNSVYLILGLSIISSPFLALYYSSSTAVSVLMALLFIAMYGITIYCLYNRKNLEMYKIFLVIQIIKFVSLWIVLFLTTLALAGVYDSSHLSGGGLTGAIFLGLTLLVEAYFLYVLWYYKFTLGFK